MKRSALKAMRRHTPRRNTWLAMLGPCVAVPHGEKMAELACYCARVRELQTPDKRLNQLRERMAKRRIAPRLAALLFDSLAQLDAQPLEQFAAIVRRIRQHNADGQPALVTHDKAFRIAEVEWIKGKPLKRSELLKQLGVSSKEHDDTSRERKAIKFAGPFLVPAKRGRPQKPGTRKPRK